MAAVSAWAKPGAWALDSEENEAMEQHQKGYDSSDSSHNQSSSDFPSLAAAAVSKTSKKKKAQTLSLAEFTTGQAVSHGAGGRFQPSARSAAAVTESFTPSKGLTHDELIHLPTGPRERSAEELERSSRGFGYSSYGGGGGRGSGRGSGDGDSNSRWGSSRASDESRRGGSGGGFERDSGPSRADEVDDWGATKRSAPPPSERRDRGGGFFDSQSRADESDSWTSKKTVAPPSDGRRMNGGGFDGPREKRVGFEMFNKEGSNGDGPDSGTWGRKREETSSGGRPRLVLQPRSAPLANGSNGEQNRGEQQVPVVKSKGSNPFGEARPREEVLAEKGQDWKVIDEKLESVKIHDASPEGTSFAKKSFGMGDGPEDRTERAWRKPDMVDVPPLMAEKIEEREPDY